MCWQVGAGTVGIDPALKGVDSFVVDNLERYSPAGQVIEAVHPEHGIIGAHLVSVQDIMDESSACGFTWGALDDQGTTADIYDKWEQNQ
jgi:hypothetical protein